MTGPAVDYVSPLPPVRSGIADYSVDLLEELAPLCDLRLVRLPGQEVASEVRRRYEVVEPAALDPARRLPFYQLGNNVYHEGVRRFALEAPGVVTVHDLRLHHLVVEATLARGDLDRRRHRGRRCRPRGGGAVRLRRAPGDVAHPSLESTRGSREDGGN